MEIFSFWCVCFKLAYVIIVSPLQTQELQKRKEKRKYKKQGGGRGGRVESCEQSIRPSIQVGSLNTDSYHTTEDKLTLQPKHLSLNPPLFETLSTLHLF